MQPTPLPGAEELKREYWRVSPLNSYSWWELWAVWTRASCGSHPGGTGSLLARDEVCLGFDSSLITLEVNASNDHELISLSPACLTSSFIFSLMGHPS